MFWNRSITGDTLRRELAPGMGTSKQNVNQIKLRALGKLRRQWETEK